MEDIEVTIDELGFIVASQLFDDDNMTLGHILDETLPFHDELVFRLEDIVEQQGYSKPELWSLQVLRVSDDPAENIHNTNGRTSHVIAVGIKGEHTIIHNGVKYLLKEGEISEVFSITNKIVPSAQNNDNVSDNKSIISWGLWNNDPHKIEINICNQNMPEDEGDIFSQKHQEMPRLHYDELTLYISPK